MRVPKVYQLVAEQVKAYKKDGKPLIVGINGVDGSGKSFFTHALKTYLEKNGEQVVTISIDDFHNPKHIRYSLGELAPKGFYHQSINYTDFINHTLNPLKHAVNYPFSLTTKTFCLESDAPKLCKQDVFENTVVLIEGIFLFRPELIKFLNYKIFIDADFDTTFVRMVKRDLPADHTPNDLDSYAHRFAKKYKAGQELYIQEVNPKQKANIIINNNDYKNPELIMN